MSTASSAYYTPIIFCSLFLLYPLVPKSLHELFFGCCWHHFVVVIVVKKYLDEVSEERPFSLSLLLT